VSDEGNIHLPTIFPKQKITYDKERDIAFSSFIGVNSISPIGKEEADNVIVFRDTSSGSAVGFTLIQFFSNPEVWKESLGSLEFSEFIHDFVFISRSEITG